MFHVLACNSGIIESNGKLKSFKNQLIIDSPLIRKIKLVGQKGIDIIIGAIDDPDDNIRLKAIEVYIIILLILIIITNT